VCLEEREGEREREREKEGDKEKEGKKDKEKRARGYRENEEWTLLDSTYALRNYLSNEMCLAYRTISHL